VMRMYQDVESKRPRRLLDAKPYFLCDSLVILYICDKERQEPVLVSSTVQKFVSSCSMVGVRTFFSCLLKFFCWLDECSSFCLL